MSTRLHVLFTIAFGATLPCLAQTPEPFEVRRAEGAFEELPVLNASEILRPEFFAGPHHKVREPVPTRFGANQFTATFSLATLPMGGGAGAALTVTDVSSSFDEMLREKSPTDLKIINPKTLLGLGAGAKETERFLNNSAFSPSEQTAFVLNLRSLNGVANRGAFVRTAGETSSEESEAIFCVQTAALMSKIHKDKPLARLAMIGDFPICLAKDGTVVVAFQWDYAAWTVGAAAFADDVQKFAAQTGKNRDVFVALSGQVSPRLRQELETRGLTVQNRLASGPLK